MFVWTKNHSGVHNPVDGCSFGCPPNGACVGCLVVARYVQFSVFIQFLARLAAFYPEVGGCWLALAVSIGLSWTTIVAVVSAVAAGTARAVSIGAAIALSTVVTPCIILSIARRVILPVVR